MIYLTSDPHFGHENIIKYVKRPFSNADEMDKVLIENFNKTVKPDDILYILGDFTMHGSYTKCMKYREQINCDHVHLIIGNHDKKFHKSCVETGKPQIYESEDYYAELTYNNTKFCLSHYPFYSWNGRDHGSIMCHGHIHSSRRWNEINQWQQLCLFDVGVDANDYTPVSLDYIYEYFNKSPSDIYDLDLFKNQFKA